MTVEDYQALPEQEMMMEALKRAYAEVILNTAKEAAEQVLEAELRARRLEEELLSTKEEAARMLLRLKEMIDEKSKEAEIKSLNQQTKLHELECQLNEAEGVILDLREELNQVQEQLDEEKKKRFHPAKQTEKAEDCYMLPDSECDGFRQSGPGLMTDDGKLSCLDMIALSYNCSSSAEHKLMENSEYDSCDKDSSHASAHMTKTELLMTGLKQGSGITETQFVNEPSYFGEKSNHSNNSTYIEIMNEVENIPKLGDNRKHHAVSIVRRSSRKRKLKFWGDVMIACGLPLSSQLKKPCEVLLHPSHCTSCKTQKCTQSHNDKFQAEAKTQLKECYHHAEDIPSREPRNPEKQPEKDMELIDVIVQEDELAAAFDLNSSSRIDCVVEAVTATKESIANHSSSKRAFQYTFRRKNKKKSVIYPEKVSCEEIFSGKSFRFKQVNNSCIDKSSLPNECSRDSKQLVQVAHQLISLSERGGCAVADEI